MSESHANIAPLSLYYPFNMQFANRTSPFRIKGMCGLAFKLYRNSCINTIDIDTDHTSRRMASDLGQRCLPRSLAEDFGH